jgi:rhodanese-related sulfurtransferase
VLADVRRDHRRVDHLEPERFNALAARAEKPIVFDVREESEFAVSHLPGAIRLDPGMSAEAFRARYGDALKGKSVVFYCSVGKRSSLLAERVKTVAETSGAVAIHNLDGGLFRWHNEGRSLSSARGETRVIHPYDTFWGRYLRRQDQVTYTPRPN